MGFLSGSLLLLHTQSCVLAVTFTSAQVRDAASWLHYPGVLFVARTLHPKPVALIS